MLYDAGVDPKSAQKFLGHADLQVTLKIYTHLSAEKENGSVAALNRFLGEGDGLGADANEKNACEGNVGGNIGGCALDPMMPFGASSSS
jgi:hypothetical protein